MFFISPIRIFRKRRKSSRQTNAFTGQKQNQQIPNKAAGICSGGKKKRKNNKTTKNPPLQPQDLSSMEAMASSADNTNPCRWVLVCHKGWDLLFPNLYFLSWRGPSSLAITGCGCRGRAKPGFPTALGERRVMAQAIGGWRQHRAGVNASALMTSHSSSPPSPQGRLYSPRSGSPLPT